MRQQLTRADQTLGLMDELLQAALKSWALLNLSISTLATTVMFQHTLHESCNCLEVEDIADMASSWGNGCRKQPDSTHLSSFFRAH